MFPNRRELLSYCVGVNTLNVNQRYCSKRRSGAKGLRRPVTWLVHGEGVVKKSDIFPLYLGFYFS